MRKEQDRATSDHLDVTGIPLHRTKPARVVTDAGKSETAARLCDHVNAHHRRTPRVQAHKISTETTQEFDEGKARLRLEVN
jgi:hypothetical protein